MAVPGSMPSNARTIWEEGLRVPPVRIYNRGVLNKGVLGSELCDAIRSVARGRRLLPRVPPSLAHTLRSRLAEPEQMLFGMLLAAIPRDEICRALGMSERELGACTEAMLRTLEALPGEAPPRRRPRGGLDLDSTVAAR